MIEAEDTDSAVTRKPVKSGAAFRTISEVSEDLDVPQHVLRFWESKFSQIRPLKRGGGRRYYRPEDLALLKRIRDLLYKDGYTIRGVQKLLREQSRGQPSAASQAKVDSVAVESGPKPEPAAHSDLLAGAEPIDEPLPARDELLALLGELKDLRELLRRARGS